MAYILQTNTVATVANQLRARGKRVILTHGTFDLFHIGHLAFLRKSKLQGDLLIVGVDSDQWASMIKGSDRPIYPLEHRMEIISDLNEADFVFVGGDHRSPRENYWVSLYEKFHPNAVTFGRDFGFKKQFSKKSNRVKGTRYLEIKTPFNGKIGTTKIIREILERAVK